MINEATIQRIKTANDIFDVVAGYVALRRAGSSFTGICPFHEDKSPSLTISKARQTYRCWACGAHGDVINFVKDIEHVEFHEAVKMLGRKAGIEVEDRELSPEELQYAKDRESMQITLEASTKFFESKLKEAEATIKARGYSLQDQVLKDFRIGYAPLDNQLLSHMTAAGYSTDTMLKVDLVKQGKHDLYDTFRDRIQFPFLDLNGRVIGFSGRIVTPNDKAAKYINTGETPIYTKGKVLFGLYQAKQEIVRTENAYLVEGQFDVTSFHRWGVRNTVAGSGTALTAEQVKMLGRFTRKVTLVYDADKAGTSASLKNCEILLQAGLSVRCISLPSGMDPDNLAWQEKDNLAKWLQQRSVDFVAYFYAASKPNDKDPDSVAESLNNACILVAAVQDDIKRNEFIKSLCSLYKVEDQTQAITAKIKGIRGSSSVYKKTDVMKPGVYGIDELKEGLKSRFDEYERIIVTSDFNEFLNDHTESPCIYIHKDADTAGIQELRATAPSIYVKASQLTIDRTKENHFLSSIVNIYKMGLTDVFVQEEGDDESENELPFVNWYFNLYAGLVDADERFKSTYINRCAELLSFSPESVRLVYAADFAKKLSIPKSALDAILKPLVDRKKNKLKIEAQRDDNALEVLDGSSIPAYVEENEQYRKMYQNYQYFPYLNSKGEPVAYVFKDKSGHIIVGDFYLEPLLHIYNKDPELNRRIFKVNRRFYVKPFFMEFKSSSLLMKTSFEAVIINEEAMNFDNAGNDHWIRIKSCMSHHYTMVNEINVYGQQPEDFFAFSNAICHRVDGRYQIDLSNDLGVTSHSEKNYYHPSSSVINRDAHVDDDKYEIIRQLKYDGKHVTSTEEPLLAIHAGDEYEPERRERFKIWAELMDKVYSINDNGKWALIYAIMCAYRSDIHSIDRFFTALFFMGPTMSGKTQVAISIRSLYITPKQPAFNLNTGTDAAMSTLMGTFRDVPVVLEEYNNKEISDVKFQALKAITYDGDAKQKRKGTSGKDIESDKIFAPVIICGQETPQRDDNALMNRIIVCEVPKKGLFSEEAQTLFNQLKQLEKEGLSDILFEVLQLRPLIRQHYRPMMRSISKELLEKVLIGSNASGDMVRIINTVTLFLALCKIITEHAPHLQLPFTYDEFFQIASAKVISQVELITHSDKLANFFKAMDVMIDSGLVKEGRDFAIDSPQQITFKVGDTKRVEVYEAQKRVLFIRLSNVFTCYARNYNREEVTLSTIEQNLRSHPAYMGMTPSWRFKWLEEKSVPAGESIKVVDGVEQKSTDMSMRKIMSKMEKITSCMVLDYEVFLRFYEDLDLERRKPRVEPLDDEQDLPF